MALVIYRGIHVRLWRYLIFSTSLHFFLTLTYKIRYNMKRADNFENCITLLKKNEKFSIKDSCPFKKILHIFYLVIKFINQLIFENVSNSKFQLIFSSEFFKISYFSF